MKDIFDIINNKQTNQQPQNQTSQANQKSYMQQLVEQGKEDISAYALPKQKCFVLKHKLKKQIIEAIKNIDQENSLDKILEYIKIANYKKLPLDKIEIKFDDDTKMNLLEYTLYNFKSNIETKSEIVRYLIANCNGFDYDDTLTECLFVMLGYNKNGGEYLLKNCPQEFLKTYKLLIDHGATNYKIRNVFFDYRGKLLYQNPNIIEILFYEDQSTVLRKLLDSFYVCEKPQEFYPIMKRYHYSPRLGIALQNIRYISGEKVLRYLVENNVFQKQDITDQAIRVAMAQIKIRKSDQKARFIARAEAIRTGTQTMPIQKPLKNVQKPSNKDISFDINKIFENAVKNTEITM